MWRRLIHFNVFFRVTLFVCTFSFNIAESAPRWRTVGPPSVKHQGPQNWWVMKGVESTATQKPDKTRDEMCGKLSIQSGLWGLRWLKCRRKERRHTPTQTASTYSVSHHDMISQLSLKNNLQILKFYNEIKLFNRISPGFFYFFFFWYRQHISDQFIKSNAMYKCYR